MAYTLKASGIATNLVMCVAVDSDGTTVKEFVSSDVNSNKTMTGVTTGAALWKGTSRGYFVVSGTTGAPNCVEFPSGHRPTWDISGSNTGSVFVALSGSTNLSGAFVVDTNGAGMLGRASGTVLTMNGIGRLGTTTPPSDGTTKWCGGGNYRNGGAYQIYYSPESNSSSLTPDNSGTDPTTGQAFSITGVGGSTGLSVAPANYHIAALFNTALSDGQMQSLRDDWFGTLFNVSGAFARPYYNRLLGGSSNL